MTARLVDVSPAADRDTETHLVYLTTQAGSATAHRFQAMLAETFAAIGRFPRRGRPGHEGRPLPRGTRFVRVEGFPNWLVFYRVSARGILVIRVLHGSRDLGVSEVG